MPATDHPHSIPGMAHRRSRQLAALCAAGAAALGGIGLMDALAGQRLFSGSLMPRYIPMAVSTALLLLFFGVVLALAVARGPGRRPWLLAAVGLATLAGTWESVEYLLGLPEPALKLLYSRLLIWLSASPTPMSPLTSLLFLLTGCALGLLHWRFREPADTLGHDVAGCLGAAIGLVSLTLLGGYVHGAPLLYGSPVAPVAATTAAGLLALSVGIVSASGPGSLFLRGFFGDTVKARLMRIFPPIVGGMFLFHPVVEILVSLVFPVGPDLLFSIQVTVLAALTAAATMLAVRGVGVSMDRETEMRQQAEFEALRKSRITQAQAEISEALIRPGMTLQNLADMLHRACTQLTGSEFGFVSTIDPATGDNIGHTLTAMMTDGQCGLGRDMVFRPGANGAYPGLWGHALNTLEPFYTNDPGGHPAARGLPKGHVPLERFLSVPVRYEQQLVGQIGLANPDRDYTAEDLETVLVLASLFALGVQRIRSEQSILAAKQDLEETVRQRTSALEETNIHLTREVAEREMFQEALKESGALFRAVVEDQTELICRFRPDGTILFVNNAYARAFGRRPDELTGLVFYDFLTPEAQEQVRGLLGSINPENPVRAHEHTVLLPSGGVAWQSWTNRGIFDEDGRLQAFQAVGRDITQAKEAERALRELNERLEEKVRERTIQLEDRARSIQRINVDLEEQVATRQRAEEALSRAAGDLQARVRQITCLYELSAILGDGSLSMDQMLERVVEKIPSGWRTPDAVGAELVLDGEPRRSAGYQGRELCLRHALRVFGVERGQLTVCDATASENSDDAGPFPADELDLFSSAVHQIERALEGRLSQDLLASSERKFREFFDNAADAVFVHDAQGRILDANRNAGDWLGANTESLRGGNLLELAPEAERRGMAESFLAAAKGQPVLLQATLVRADGRGIPVEFSCLAMDYQGIPALYSSARNIAGRLEDEREILRRMEAEALVADISEHLVNSPAEQFSSAFERSLGELGRHLRLEHVAVFSFDAGEERFRRSYRWRDMSQLPLGRGVRGFCARLTPVLLEPFAARERLVIPDTALLPPDSPEASLLRDAGLRCLLALPMSIRGRLTGALVLAGTRAPLDGEFSEFNLLDSAALLLANAQEKQGVDRSLRESERLARSIIESLAANICVVDRNGVLTMVNRSWERFAQENAAPGTPRLGVGANYIDICRQAATAGEPLAEEAAEGIAAVLAGKRSIFNLEYDCHSPTEQRWFSMQVVPFSGGGSGAVIAHRDITARVLAARDVQKSEERYRIIVETAQEGVLGVDAQSHITYANPRMLSMLGFSRVELLGRALSQIIAPEDLDMVRSQQKRRQQGLSDQYELRYLAKDGTRVWTVTSVTPVMGPDGVYAGAIGMAMDISDKVRAEQLTRKTEARYKSLVEAMQEGLLLLRADGTVSYANEPFARMLGKSGEDILDRPAMALASAQSRKTLADMLATGRPDPGAIEVVWEHASGRHIYSLVSLSPSQDEEGGAPGHLAIITDTTERKALESHLLQSQKLEAIGQLAAGIAHEINTPAQYVGSNIKFIKTAFEDLAEIILAMRQVLQAARQAPPTQADLDAVDELLRQRELDYLETEVPGAIAQTLDGVDRISTIVRSVKLFAHPGVAVMAPADLNEAMRSTVTVSRNEWKYVADLTTDLDGDLPLVVCMIGEINQVVLNLIVNAAHAIADVVRDTPEGRGRITLSTRHAPPWAEIRVSDSGAGIPPEVQAKIFDPFFTTKEVGKGTGQGLTISRGIVVDKHKGQLFFETEQGKGTTFVVRLPLEQSEERE